MFSFTYAVSLDAELDVSGELAFEGFVIILFKGFHVVSYMLSHDVGTVNVSVKLRFFLVVTRESFLAVGDFDAAIGSTLHGAKNTGSGGGTSKTDIQASTEGSRTIIIVFDHEVLSVDLGTACISSIQVQLFEDLMIKSKLVFLVTGYTNEMGENHHAFEPERFTLPLSKCSDDKNNHRSSSIIQGK